jgi:beta-N-acetylglucosaminidase/fibronectin type 3 domain-containing protein/uncharacterized protein YraI
MKEKILALIIVVLLIAGGFIPNQTYFPEPAFASTTNIVSTVTPKTIVTAGDSKVVLKWNAAAGATAYRVYSYNTTAKSYTRLAILSASTLTYTNSGLKNGVKYTYLVRSFNGLRGSAYSTVNHVSAIPIATPKLTATAGDSKVTLKWNAVTGATFYRVYTYNAATKAYKIIATPTASTLTYTHTGLTNGTTYTYLVRGFNALSGSAYSTVNHVSAIPITTPKLTATAGDAKVTLKWNAVTGATEYRLYTYNNTTKAYTRIATPTASTLTYTHTGLTNGTTYTYLVRGFNALSGSAYSTINHVSAIPIATPKLTATAGDTKVTLKWTSVVGATEYRVYTYNTTTKAYTRIATPSASELTYIHTGLTNGTTYTYLVRGFNTLSGSAFSIANHVSATPTSPFDAYLSAQGFPESYKPALRALHASNPKWIFKAQATGVDWSSALAKEQQLGRSLVAAGDYDSWKSFEDGAYDFINNNYIGFDGTWPAADDCIVAYYFDPRNFLNQTAIYQFMDHHFDANSQNKVTIRCIAAGSFLDTDGYASLIYDSGKASGVNPNVITSIIRQEQGTAGTSGLISGTYAGYEGYYNFFNVGAYTTSTMSAIQHGLWWAKGEGVGATSYNRPWNTKTKSVTGGALYYRANYLDQNQYTFYLKKFNVMNGADNVAKHQYMTYIRAANSEGISMGKAYINNPDYPLVFYIPVYNNMPATAVAQPGTTGNNDNVLNSLRVINADTESQYSLVASSGNGGFYRYTTNYSVNVPTSVSKLIINGVAHNNVSYVSGTTGNIILGAYDSDLPAGYKNIGSTKLTTTITVDPLKIYSGAGLSFSSIGSYKKGTVVTVTGTANDSLGALWYKVSYAGKTGYISSGGTNKLTTTKYYSDWMTGTTNVNLNVRKTPSTAQTALGTIASGTKINIYGYVINPDGSKWYMTSYKGATVTGGDVVTLHAGTNIVSLSVTSTSGQKRTYTITVNRT